MVFSLLTQNTDASLIPTVSWPAFGIHEETLIHRTMDKVVRKLKGKYGFKRFFRDGYGTVIEDKNRKHYRPSEIKVRAFLLLCVLVSKYFCWFLNFSK